MYTLGGGIHEEQGWGRGRRDLRRHGRARGATASGRPGSGSVTATSPPTSSAPRCSRRAIRSATSPRPCAGAGSRASRLLPMSDDRVETHVVIDDPEAPGGRRAVHFQEYWVRLHAEPTAHAIVAGRRRRRQPRARACSRRIASADVVLLPPSQPGREHRHGAGRARHPRDALETTDAPVVGLSPIVGGAPVRGMADKVLAAIGVETSAAAVALHYGSARRPARRLAGRHRRRRRGRPRRGGRHRLPCRAAAHDRRRARPPRWPARRCALAEQLRNAR